MVTAAAAAAPHAPGIYVFLGPQAQLRYVGKAVDLRRRLAQHALGKGRLARLYPKVAEVRWVVLADEPTAAAREADVIVALQPPWNASHRGEGRWAYVSVDHGGRSTFTLATEPGPVSFGCFAHLGPGVASAPAIACSDGYAALLRLLWAASPAAGTVPAALTRSAPAHAAVLVDPERRRPLRDLLNGTSTRLLDLLVADAGWREGWLQPSIARDRVAARAFFATGPAELRALRRRHGVGAGQLDRSEITALVAADLVAAVGEVRLPPSLPAVWWR